jgi:hypothetical protein
MIERCAVKLSNVSWVTVGPLKVYADFSVNEDWSRDRLWIEKDESVIQNASLGDVITFKVYSGFKYRNIVGHTTEVDSRLVCTFQAKVVSRVITTRQDLNISGIVTTQITTLEVEIILDSAVKAKELNP